MKYLIALFALSSLPLHAQGGPGCYAVCMYKVVGDVEYRTRQMTAMLDNSCASLDKMESECKEGTLTSKLVTVDNPDVTADILNSCGYTPDQLKAIFGQ